MFSFAKSAIDSVFRKRVHPNSSSDDVGDESNASVNDAPELKKGKFVESFKRWLGKSSSDQEQDQQQSSNINFQQGTPTPAAYNQQQQPWLFYSPIPDQQSNQSPVFAVQPAQAVSGPVAAGSFQRQAVHFSSPSPPPPYFSHFVPPPTLPGSTNSRPGSSQQLIQPPSPQPATYLFNPNNLRPIFSAAGGPSGSPSLTFRPLAAGTATAAVSPIRAVRAKTIGELLPKNNRRGLLRSLSSGPSQVQGLSSQAAAPVKSLQQSVRLDELQCYQQLLQNMSQSSLMGRHSRSGLLRSESSVISRSNMSQHPLSRQTDESPTGGGASQVNNHNGDSSDDIMILHHFRPPIHNTATQYTVAASVAKGEDNGTEDTPSKRAELRIEELQEMLDRMKGDRQPEPREVSKITATVNKSSSRTNHISADTSDRDCFVVSTGSSTPSVKQNNLLSSSVSVDNFSSQSQARPRPPSPYANVESRRPISHLLESGESSSTDKSTASQIPLSTNYSSSSSVQQFYEVDLNSSPNRHHDSESLKIRNSAAGKKPVNRNNLRTSSPSHGTLPNGFSELETDYLTNDSFHVPQSSISAVHYDHVKSNFRDVSSFDSSLPSTQHHRERFSPLPPQIVVSAETPTNNVFSSQRQTAGRESNGAAAAAFLSPTSTGTPSHVATDTRASASSSSPPTSPVVEFVKKYASCKYVDENFLHNFEKSLQISSNSRDRQIEEQRVKCSILAEKKRHNEIQIDKRIRQRMRLAEQLPPVVDQFLYLTEDPEHPALDEDANETIDAALRTRDTNKVLIDKFKISIRKNDLSTLSGLNWLNDEVINFYLSLLMERGKQEPISAKRRVYAQTTFFYPTLQQGGYQRVRRWTKKIDIFAHDYILFPIHLGVHWCMCIANMKGRTLLYYDSMGSTNHQCLDLLSNYLVEEYRDKKGSSGGFNLSNWKIGPAKNIPHQLNGSDCGMFACRFAEYVTREVDINFTQANMPYFRRRTIYEILQGRLML